VTYVALLRGINVGGKNKVDMKLLKAVFEDEGMRVAAQRSENDRASVLTRSVRLRATGNQSREGLLTPFVPAASTDSRQAMRSQHSRRTPWLLQGERPRRYHQ
jgi:hypothetical protein